MEDQHFSLSEVAIGLRVSERTVRRWIKAGKLKAYKPGRDFRIPESAVRELVERGEVSPKAQAARLLEPSFNDVLAEERHDDVDVRALDEALAEDLRQQREGRLRELDSKLGRAGDDQERREEAYRNLKNWWVLFLQPVMTVHKHIPGIPGPALLREGNITVERVREFARRTYTNEAERDAELQALEALLTNEAHAANE
jgi:excisionase family DNA binding protein